VGHRSPRIPTVRPPARVCVCRAEEVTMKNGDPSPPLPGLYRPPPLSSDVDDHRLRGHKVFPSIHPSIPSSPQDGGKGDEAVTRVRDRILLSPQHLERSTVISEFRSSIEKEYYRGEYRFRGSLWCVVLPPAPRTCARYRRTPSVLLDEEKALLIDAPGQCVASTGTIPYRG